MLILTNEEVERLVSMAECISILREMYLDLANDRCLLMPRVDSIAPTSQEGGYYAFKHMGGIWPRYGIIALRINSDIITHPQVGGVARRVKVPLAGGRWVGLVQLYSIETGELLAIFPDGVAQRLRVGATSALGIDYLARREVRRAGLIGSGWQAGGQLLGLLAVRPIEEVKVYSLRPERRQAFVEEMGQVTGVSMRAVDTAAECAEDVDILLSATSSIVPVLRPEWLRAGMHVGCIKVEEVDKTFLRACDRVVLHNKRQITEVRNILPGTSNVPREVASGWWNDPEVPVDTWPELSAMIAGCASGRCSENEITCFINNLGMGLQFAALGVLILKKARALGVGRELPDEWFSETVHP